MCPGSWLPFWAPEACVCERVRVYVSVRMCVICMYVCIHRSQWVSMWVCICICVDMHIWA